MGGKNSITFFQSSHPPNKCIFVLVKGAPNLSLQSGKKKKTSCMAPEDTDGPFMLYFPLTKFMGSSCWTHTDI